jgi:hypothetical protein
MGVPPGASLKNLRKYRPRVYTGVWKATAIFERNIDDRLVPV